MKKQSQKDKCNHCESMGKHRHRMPCENCLNLNKMRNKIVKGDCLEIMKDIPDQSIDMVLSDPPYGTTACKWDSVIDLDLMWIQLKRIIKPKGAIVMTASQPFTSRLIMSNIKQFKYCWVWHKSRALGFQNAKHKPMRNHEDIAVFSDADCANRCKRRMSYNPQGLIEINKKVSGLQSDKHGKNGLGFKRPSHKKEHVQKYTGYPKSVITIPNEFTKCHPTQKPVALMEYLIKTYTNPGELILDIACGSGTTCVAAKQQGRDFIGIELDKDTDYCTIARQRLKEIKEIK